MQIRLSSQPILDLGVLDNVSYVFNTTGVSCKSILSRQPVPPKYDFLELVDFTPQGNDEIDSPLFVPNQPFNGDVSQRKFGFDDSKPVKSAFQSKNNVQNDEYDFLNAAPASPILKNKTKFDNSPQPKPVHKERTKIPFDDDFDDPQLQPIPKKNSKIPFNNDIDNPQPIKSALQNDEYDFLNAAPASPILKNKTKFDNSPQPMPKRSKKIPFDDDFDNPLPIKSAFQNNEYDFADAASASPILKNKTSFNNSSQIKKSQKTKIPFDDDFDQPQPIKNSFQSDEYDFLNAPPPMSILKSKLQKKPQFDNYDNPQPVKSSFQNAEYDFGDAPPSASSTLRKKRDISNEDDSFLSLPKKNSTPNNRIEVGNSIIIDGETYNIISKISNSSYLCANNSSTFHLKQVSHEVIPFMPTNPQYFLVGKLISNNLYITKYCKYGTFQRVIEYCHNRPRGTDELIAHFYLLQMLFIIKNLEEKFLSHGNINMNTLLNRITSLELTKEFDINNPSWIEQGIILCNCENINNNNGNNDRVNVALLFHYFCTKIQLNNNVENCPKRWNNEIWNKTFDFLLNGNGNADEIINLIAIELGNPSKGLQLRSAMSRINLHLMESQN
ncbi:hypothetical protein GPJ56_007036 [Histomonas meleagridis]|uniref:uncharacterized protein n=1 Tax=Histomonas meleagridis TaxID=135588 RepID=UPI003559A7C8|nr:hypothetical protein GPJ56_007036 [Histomonas meleagridis]KAH0800189.1 hypothetical protein GO595_007301 [Histomonas meleagridis]